MVRTLAFACLTFICGCTLLVLFAVSSVEYQTIELFREACRNGKSSLNGPTEPLSGFDGGLTPLACIYVGESTFLVPLDSDHE